MKKTFLILLALASAASFAQASLILSNSFDYSDGNLTTVSAGSPLGVWTNHSGSGSITVSGGKIGLSQSLGEDVSTGLPGGPISTGTLYASFVVNFSAVPTANSGSYFFHFRDTGTSNFRGKVFATNYNGACRVGIAVGGVNTPALIPTDLVLGSDYKLVLRYNIDTTNATLWINPTSESSIVNRADATDTTSSKFGYYSACFRQAGGIGVLTVDDLLIGTAFEDVQTIGGPPSISGLVDVHMPWNTNSGAMPFLVSDVETPAGSLAVAATSDNPALVPNNPANLTFGGSGGNRTLTVTPAAGQQGLANVEVVVTDENNETGINTFKVYVGEPTISAIANQFAPTNTVIGPVAFTVGDAETPGSLTVTPASDNEGVIPAANVVVSPSGTSRTVTITPAPDAAGTATITLTVNDGTWNIPTSFKVTFYPKFGLVLGDTFTYDNGSVTTNSGGFWFTHSGGTGTTGQTQVLNGKVNLTSSQGEDVSAGFTNFLQSLNNGIVLYSSFKVNFSALPTGNGGDYFVNVRDGGVNNLRMRVFAATNGAAPGTFRIAIANGGFTLATVPRDLNTNTTYLVLTRYNVDTAQSTVWVNPDSEAAGGATASDSTTPVTLYYFCLRQSGGIGTLTLDDVKVGTQWSDVWEAMAPTAEPLQYNYAGGTLTLSWNSPAFALQAAPAVTGTYTNVTGASSPYPVPASDTQKYFRLKY